MLELAAIVGEQTHMNKLEVMADAGQHSTALSDGCCTKFNRKHNHMFVVEMIDQTLNVPFWPGIRSLFQLSYNFCMLHGP